MTLAIDPQVSAVNPLPSENPDTAPRALRSNPPPRLASLDVYRGFVMFLMASEGFGLYSVARHFKSNLTWQFLARQTDHVEWTGCALWDLIQPSFSFIVGVAMPYSLASRRAKGRTFKTLFFHALIRSLILIFLGVFLRSMHSKQTNFTFEDTLSQIGLGYPFLFLLAWTQPRTQGLVFLAILIGYWGAFALYPLPAAGFDWAAVNVPADWPHPHGFAAHWDKNSNLAWAFDTWFLNLFRRPAHFTNNAGGYATLSFIPTLATMILGLLAGELLRAGPSRWKKVLLFIAAGAAGLGLGILLDRYGICPSVKRIWTPAWVLFSGGWCFLLMAFFYVVCDWVGWRKWAFVFTVIGMNSIAIYCLADGAREFIEESLRIHLGPKVFYLFGALAEGSYWRPVVQRTVVLGILWLICFWMYRKKIFIRI